MCPQYHAGSPVCTLLSCSHPQATTSLEGCLLFSEWVMWLLPLVHLSCMLFPSSSDSPIEVIACTSTLALLFVERARSTVTMASMTTMEKLLLFHKLESDLFHRLVHDLAQDPAAMRWVIALWLWLESVGHHNFIRRVAALPGPVVLRFVEEAVACLRCLAGQCQAATADVEDGRGKRLPCTNALLTEPIDDAGYFQSHREILDGVTHYYRSVCLAVCNVNNSTTCMPNNTAGVPVAPPMVSSPIHTTPRVAPLPLNPMAASFPLNPMATPWIPMQSPLMEAPWIPMQSPLPDDYRSLFITFSKGYPISREDIMEFFDS